MLAKYNVEPWQSYPEKLDGQLICNPDKSGKTADRGLYIKSRRYFGASMLDHVEFLRQGAEPCIGYERQSLTTQVSSALIQAFICSRIDFGYAIYSGLVPSLSLKLVLPKCYSLPDWRHPKFGRIYLVTYQQKAGKNNITAPFSYAPSSSMIICTFVITVRWTKVAVIFRTASSNSNTYFMLVRTPLCVCYVNVYQFLQESSWLADRIRPLMNFTETSTHRL